MISGLPILLSTGENATQIRNVMKLLRQFESFEIQLLCNWKCNEWKLGCFLKQIKYFNT